MKVKDKIIFILYWSIIVMGVSGVAVLIGCMLYYPLMGVVDAMGYSNVGT